MIDLKNIKVGDKVKTQLLAFTCWDQETPKKEVTFKKWWTVETIIDEVIKIKSNNEVMYVDLKGRGLMPNTNHHIYKLKRV